MLYREILTDACDKMKVNYNNKSSVETIEMNLLMKIPEKSLEKMTPDQLKTVAEELQTGQQPHAGVADHGNPCGDKTSGFAAYQMALVVTNGVAKALLGRGLTVAGNAMLTRTMGAFAGPVGWVLSSLWLLIDLAGPAYRVTLPSCILLPTCARSIFIHQRMLTFSTYISNFRALKTSEGGQILSATAGIISRQKFRNDA